MYVCTHVFLWPLFWKKPLEKCLICLGILYVVIKFQLLNFNFGQSWVNLEIKVAQEQNKIVGSKYFFSFWCDLIYNLEYRSYFETSCYMWP